MKCKFHKKENCKICSHGEPRPRVRYGHASDNDSGTVTINNLAMLDQEFADDNVYKDRILSPDLVCGPNGKTAKEFYSSLVKLIDNDVVVNGARCKCKKQPYLGKYQIGTFCPTCRTEIKRDVDESSAYIEADGTNFFMNPSVIYILSKTQLGKVFLNIVKRGGGKWSATKQQKAYNGGRPYAFTKRLIEIFGSMPTYRIFEMYFETILMIGLSILKSSVKDKEDRMVLTMLIDKYKEDAGYVYSRYIKLPPSLFMVQRNVVNNTMFRTTALTAEIISRYVATVTLDESTPNLNNLVTKMHGWISFKIYASMNVTTKEVLKKKKGFFRGDLSSGRASWSMYNVLTQPIGYEPSLNHTYLPWRTGLITLREPILYYLISVKGMDGLEAVKLIEDNYSTYNETLNEAFDACEDFGFTMTENRPPQLHVGSFFQLAIKVKRDPKIKTHSIHPLLFKTLNADTDGDNLLGVLDTSKTLQGQNAIFRPSNLTFAGPAHSLMLTTILKTTAYNFTNYMLRKYNNDKQFNWHNRRPPSYIKGVSKTFLFDNYKQGVSHATGVVEQARPFYPERQDKIDIDLFPKKIDDGLNDLINEYTQVIEKYNKLKAYIDKEKMESITLSNYLKGKYNISVIKQAFGRRAKLSDHIVNPIFASDGFFETKLYEIISSII